MWKLLSLKHFPCTKKWTVLTILQKIGSTPKWHLRTTLKFALITKRWHFETKFMIYCGRPPISNILWYVFDNGLCSCLAWITRLVSTIYSLVFFLIRCSVDPYLFEHFNTVDGDFLSAKFRAFKFPESTYVQFRGTVSVCLDKCKGVSGSPFYHSFQDAYSRQQQSRIQNESLL